MTAQTEIRQETTASVNKSGNIFKDSLTEAGRHLRVLPRNVEVLIFSTIQPIMFILLFSVVFGGSIVIDGFEDYDQYLMPGIFAQTIVFGTSFTGVGLAEDLSKGFIDRLRSLPISQSAVLIGRTLSDLFRNVFTFVIMLLVAFLLGFRFNGGPTLYHDRLRHHHRPLQRRQISSSTMAE